MREVRVDIGQEVVVPVFSMPRREWSKFCDDHDMTDEDAYVVPLIVACTGWSEEDAQEAWDEWPTDAALTLATACLEESMPSGHDWAVERLKTDAYLALELAVCREYRIPLSAFHAWSERDQDLAIAQYVVALDHCPGCGAPTDAMKNPSLVKLTSRTCLVCQHKHAVQKDMPPELSPYTHLSVAMNPQETP